MLSIWQSGAGGDATQSIQHNDLNSTLGGDSLNCRDVAPNVIALTAPLIVTAWLKNYDLGVRREHALQPPQHPRRRVAGYPGINYLGAAATRVQQPFELRRVGLVAWYAVCMFAVTHAFGIACAKRDDLGCGRDGGSQRQCDNGWSKAPSHERLLARAKRAPRDHSGLCIIPRTNSGKRLSRGFSVQKFKYKKSLLLAVLAIGPDAGMTAYPRAEAAGVRKAPRHEIAGRGTDWAVPRAQLWGFGRARATAEVGSEVG
jgi:hypothetical protein